MKNPLSFPVVVTERTNEHFSGKKKPWEGRVKYPAQVYIVYAVELALFVVLLWLMPGLRSVLVLVAALSMWGMAVATKAKYYRIGYLDGKEDSMGRSIAQND